MSTNVADQIPIQPSFATNKKVFDRFRRLVRFLAAITRDEPDFPSVVQDFRRRALDQFRGDLSPDVAAARVAFSVLADLFVQGWDIEVIDNVISCIRPSANDDPALEKVRVKGGLMIARDEQLREPNVRDFIRGMEQQRLFMGKWVSIYTLMADGVEIANRLENIRDLSGDERQAALSQAIQPYLEFADESTVCPFTGLRSFDIWRYFRHTWLTPLRSTPGRTMPILIRDAAHDHHPIIGIAALSSSIVQQSERDKWIGWRGEDILRTLDQNPTREAAAWLISSLEDQIESLYVGDFLQDEIIERKDLRSPHWDVMERLRSLAEEQKELHKMQPPGNRVRSSAAGDYLSEAKSMLFTGKRAATLADLLEIKLAFNQAGFVLPDATSLEKALTMEFFRLSVAKLTRRIKGSHVGINMMDISVAGAIEPYRAILGGKLVSMLLCSPEIVQEYERRYSKQPSIIASSMKGRAVLKRPQLALLCTTGLFGAGSSQYNRISIPAGSDAIRFVKLEQRTEYGTFHFSNATVAEMKRLSELDFRGTITNGIFGEGVNPRMRKIRENLDQVGLPANEFLKHSSPRVVYVIELCRNFRDVLTGRSEEPEYYIPASKGEYGTQAISEHWISRWLSSRINNEEALMQVRNNSAAMYFNHGARVQLPEMEEEQASLFEELEDDDIDFD